MRQPSFVFCSVSGRRFETTISRAFALGFIPRKLGTACKLICLLSGPGWNGTGQLTHDVRKPTAQNFDAKLAPNGRNSRVVRSGSRSGYAVSQKSISRIALSSAVLGGLDRARAVTPSVEVLTRKCSRSLSCLKEHSPPPDGITELDALVRARAGVLWSPARRRNL